MSPSQASELQTGLDEAEALRAAGQHEQAGRRLHQLAVRFPGNAEIRFRLGQIAANRGDLDGCRTELEQAVESDAENPAYLVRLGNVCERLGDAQSARAAYERAIAIDSKQVAACIRLVEIYLAAGEQLAAVDMAQRIVLVQGPVAPMLSDTRLPPALRRSLQRIRNLLRDKYQQLIDETRSYIDSKYEPGEVSNLHRALDHLGSPAPTGQPLHRPEFLYYPGLDNQPWFDTGDWTWLQPLHDNWREIRDEFLDLPRDSSAFAPYIVQTDSAQTLQGTDFSTLAGSRDWSAYHLNKAGWLEDKCARVPRTAAIVKQMPLATARGYMPEVFFSVLAPGTEIIPHYGQTNIRLTVHLGLIIPEECGIRVADETRHWQEGQILAFDDSFEHAAWNRSEQDRVVLIFEAWHPGLSAAEIDGLQHFFVTRAEWLSRFDDLDLPSGSHA
ncbi:MAG: tetratricopeptide repeat protein [Gammaproteobacteria bacterium]|nr:tetratricopeptide repeat protein [Gammaproteobacteria bacterium]